MTQTASTRYEVREDHEVAHLHNVPKFCVWDTQADEIYRDEVTRNRFGQVSQDYAQEMADFLNLSPAEQSHAATAGRLAGYRGAIEDVERQLLQATRNGNTEGRALALEHLGAIGAGLQGLSAMLAGVEADGLVTGEWTSAADELEDEDERVQAVDERRRRLAGQLVMAAEGAGLALTHTATLADGLAGLSEATALDLAVADAEDLDVELAAARRAVRNIQRIVTDHAVGLVE